MHIHVPSSSHTETNTSVVPVTVSEEEYMACKMYFKKDPAGGEWF